MHQFSLGKTRSGRVIGTDTVPGDLKDPRDLFDALAIFEWIVVRGKPDDTGLLATAQKMADDAWTFLIRLGVLDEMLKGVGLSSRLQIPTFGKGLVNHEFRD